MGRRGKKVGPMGGKWNISHSLQMRLALGYSCLIAVLLVLMNTYPLIMGQNLMFRSQQTALANQLVLITNTLTTADELTPETVEQAIGQLEELEVRRVLVTDGAGRVLYDTGEPSALGKYALIGEVVSALRGNDAFSSEYQDGAFSSRAASPVMNRNQVVGAVCLYDQDSDQGALLEELQRNLRLISVVSAWRYWFCLEPFPRSFPGGSGPSWGESARCGPGSTPIGSPWMDTMSWRSWLRSLTS